MKQFVILSLCICTDDKNQSESRWSLQPALETYTDILEVVPAVTHRLTDPGAAFRLGRNLLHYPWYRSVWTCSAHKGHYGPSRSYWCTEVNVQTLQPTDALNLCGFAAANKIHSVLLKARTNVLGPLHGWFLLSRWSHSRVNKASCQPCIQQLCAVSTVCIFTQEQLSACDTS